MSGRNVLQAAYYANLACRILKTACRDALRGASGEAAPVAGPLLSQALADGFARQTSLLKEQALQVIRQLPDPAQQEFLEKRYLESLTYEEIAAEMHYSRRHLFALHKAALEAIDSMS